jgi:predicted O-methyltransferase YrrM
MTTKLTPKVADALADRIVLRCAEEGLVRPGVTIDWGVYYDLRARVRETFRVPETTITPLMARVLYGISYAAGARRILGIGTYAGNALVWLALPALTADAPNRRIVGVDVDESANELARENFERLGLGGGVECITMDGHDAAEALGDIWDLVLLDADDPAGRKAIYLSLLDAVYPHLRPEGLVLAHDICVPLFHDQMAEYQERVRDEARFAVSLPLEIDDCGLEVSKKVAVARAPAAAAREEPR